MKCMKIFGYVLLALLLISTVPYAAEAGAVRIYPDQFKPIDPFDPNNYQDPSHLFGDLGFAEYYAVVQLPIGRTVTRVVMYHGSSSGATASDVTLYRSPVGVSDSYQDTMAIVSNCAGNTGNAVVAFEQTTIDYPRVKSGFRYWVLVRVTAGNRVHGVKVVYE